MKVTITLDFDAAKYDEAYGIQGQPDLEGSLQWGIIQSLEETGGVSNVDVQVGEDAPDCVVIYNGGDAICGAWGPYTYEEAQRVAFLQLIDITGVKDGDLINVTEPSREGPWEVYVEDWPFSWAVVSVSKIEN